MVLKATDSLMFIDILGDENEDSQSKIMIFSDMGIFKTALSAQ